MKKKEAVATTAHVPVWALLMIIMLGFNEFMHVLFSPMLLFFLVLVGLGLYAAYFFNLGGPTFKVAVSLLQSSVSQSRQYVLEQYDQYQHQAKIQQQQAQSKKEN